MCIQRRSTVQYSSMQARTGKRFLLVKAVQHAGQHVYGCTCCTHKKGAAAGKKVTAAEKKMLLTGKKAVFIFNFLITFFPVCGHFFCQKKSAKRKEKQNSVHFTSV